MIVTSAFLCLHTQWEHAISMNVTCRFTLLSPAKSAFKFGKLTSCTFNDQGLPFFNYCRVALVQRRHRGQWLIRWSAGLLNVVWIVQSWS